MYFCRHNTLQQLKRVPTQFVFNNLIPLLFHGGVIFFLSTNIKQYFCAICIPAHDGHYIELQIRTYDHLIRVASFFPGDLLLSHTAEDG